MKAGRQHRWTYAKRIHWTKLLSPYGIRAKTACGKWLPRFKTTNNPHAVTCRTCRAVIGQPNERR